MKKEHRLSFRLFLLISVITPVILCGCNVSVNTAPVIEDKNPAVKDVILSEAEYPFYYNTPDNKSTIKLYFADENKDIPYVDADTARELMERANHEFNTDEGYTLSVSEGGNVTTFTRDNGATMTLDNKKDVISFSDYDEFVVPSWSETVIDTLEHYGTIECLHIDNNNSYSRHGRKIDIDLGKYGIDIIENDGKSYIPMQVISDTVLSLPCYTNLIYNGEAVFAQEVTLSDDTALSPIIFSVKTGKRSRNLADFSYDELCMVMDNFYGLKDLQGIDDFDVFFTETGLKDRLLSEDPEESSLALADFLHLYLDDLHSFYISNSYLTGKDFSPFKNFGNSYFSYVETQMRFIKARSEKYPHGIPGYEEIGDTAYVTFDSFEELEEGKDYYKEFPKADTKDTVGLLLYAFNQITRKDSPVENVVFDLSANGGGDQTTACFMTSMILGRSSMTVKDSLTGAYVYESFRADANLDGVFDEKDTLAGYNLYCITSPLCFSCGNLAASELKSSKIVTMLGQTSGGGTCIVLPLTLADGTQFRVSSCRVMSNIKNGSLYDIDQGIEPDLYIGKPSDFYDREALTQYIDSGLYD